MSWIRTPVSRLAVRAPNHCATTGRGDRGKFGGLYTTKAQYGTAAENLLDKA